MINHYYYILSLLLKKEGKKDTIYQQVIGLGRQECIFD